MKTKTTGSARVVREWVRLEKMVRLYCQLKHCVHRDDLCGDCRRLLEAFKIQMDGCRFGAEKPLCANCYYLRCCVPGSWEKVETICRTTALRMLWRHPALTLYHWVDHLRCAPAGLDRTNYSCWGDE